MTIQLKPPTSHAEDGELGIEFYTRPDGPPFADIRFAKFGGALITLGSPADCDRLIRAAIAAKSRFLGETSGPLPVLAEPPTSAQWEAKAEQEASGLIGGFPTIADRPERTATPAEHADTAARIDRATGVKLCRCDRDPSSHTPWPGCPEWTS